MTVYLIQTEEERVDGSDGVEHDAVDPARQEPGERRDATGGNDVLACHALVFDTTVVS